MGRQKIDERNVRKLIKGTTSYSVTLPMEAIRDMQWKKGQKLVVEAKRGTIVIKDWK